MVEKESELSEALQKLTDKKRCFLCKKVGHFSRDCPQPRRDGAKPKSSAKFCAAYSSSYMVRDEPEYYSTWEYIKKFLNRDSKGDQLDNDDRENKGNNKCNYKNNNKRQLEIMRTNTCVYVIMYIQREDENI